MPSTRESTTELYIARGHHPFRFIGVLGQVAAGFEADKGERAEQERQYLHDGQLRRTQVLPGQPSPPSAALSETLHSPAGADSANRATRWKMRAKLGERVRWYQVPEESAH
jgi:hypothetical protein